MGGWGGAVTTRTTHLASPVGTCALIFWKAPRNPLNPKRGLRLRRLLWPSLVDRGHKSSEGSEDKPWGCLKPCFLGPRGRWVAMISCSLQISWKANHSGNRPTCSNTPRTLTAGRAHWPRTSRGPRTPTSSIPLRSICTDRC